MGQNNDKLSMQDWVLIIVTIIYLISILSLIIFGYSIVLRGLLPSWLINDQLPIKCVLTSGLGGVLYCLRGVYLNSCVKGRWDTKWTIWYFLRPLVSFITGFVSYIFLEAGILILNAQNTITSPNFGFLAIAFIAGLNVDNFIKKIEIIAESTWGISKSKTAKGKKD